MNRARLSQFRLPTLPRRAARETFDGLPPELWQVRILQQKTSWSDEGHERIAQLTRHWSDEHRRRYEQQWNWGRPARWH
jgi:hypothetical protein